MTLTRSELYRLVWSTPMTQLAKRYGLSDVGLAKVCRKHDIPRPPRGYWAKKQFNRDSPPSPLLNPDRDELIKLPKLNEGDFVSPTLSPEIEEQLAYEKRRDSPVIVSGSLHDPHDLVKIAQQQLQEGDADEHGILNIPRDAALDIRVSRACVQRSLSIMDALLKALEKRGYSMWAGPRVQILGATISFGIRERIAVYRERPAEVDLSGPYRFFHSRYVRRFVPTGRLTLHVPDAQLPWARGCRQALRDGERPLEDRLNLFIASMLETAARKADYEAEQRRKPTVSIHWRTSQRSVVDEAFDHDEGRGND